MLTYILTWFDIMIVNKALLNELIATFKTIACAKFSIAWTTVNC